MLNKFIRFFLENRLVTFLILVLVVGWGLATAPFGWKIDFLPSDPVPVDAIPDIGENQQIVFTPWAGRSPQDIEDQVSYPLTTSLLGIPGVKSIRSSSVFGFSSIYILFEEDVEFYWSRSRILEKLNSLPAGLLPQDAQPMLGPDATALGQVFWYTLEGRDRDGNVTGGWDLHEIRSVQDFYVKYALNAVDGVSEVASIGGYVQEYQVDVDPDALKAYNVPLQNVISAVKKSNRDVGAKTLEINMAEYLVRGLGYIKSVEDIEEAVVAVQDNTPIRIKDIAVTTLGPATRRGILDKEGAEVVGGVVVARHGSNPLAVIDAVKEKIREISSGLPSKVLNDGTSSQLTIVPFYDRTQLIYETLGTLEEALSLEVIITILVVIFMVLNLRASVLISVLLPVAVLMVFVGMRYVGVEANIVALSGIAIAIGTMVDLGIVLSENVIKHLKDLDQKSGLVHTIYNAASEVSSAILTAVSTTIVSFIPVFTLQAAEGKLFRPLAFTKTFALLAALFVALIILPTLAYWIFGWKVNNVRSRKVVNGLLVAAGIVISLFWSVWAGITFTAFGISGLIQQQWSNRHWSIKHLPVAVAIVSVIYLLSVYWMPLGAGRSLMANGLFVAIILILILGGFALLQQYYERILRWCLDHKVAFLLVPTLIIFLCANIWFGFANVFGFLAKGANKIGWQIQEGSGWTAIAESFPGIGKEFMPALDEGSFLLMPTSMPHAGIAQNKRVVQQLDMLVSNIPEVELAVGKMGRVESALDPAPISMYENVINYKPEYFVNDRGRRVRFKTNGKNEFLLKNGGTVSHDEAIRLRLSGDDLVTDPSGIYYRNWRKEIKSPDDIWNEIVRLTKLPGVTSAPKLQPIETRLVMLQTGMRAPMGIKVFGPDLPTIESFGRSLEGHLKQVPSVKPEAVFADRIVGKPYIQLEIDRSAIGRYGLHVEDVQQTIETAIGGMQLTTTVEGRQRFPVRVRYPRELRDDPEALGRILVSTPTGAQVPLADLVQINYVRGPQMIRSEDTFLVGYVLLDKKEGYAEVDVVEEAQQYIDRLIEEGELLVPDGVSYRFSGSYENQLRAEKRLSIIVPVVLITIFLILYFQFRSVSTSLMIFAGVALAFSGGFVLIWCYGQDWFMDFAVFGTNIRELFQMHTINLSVAVWVGFIALFGIATDDGVLIGTYLDQRFSSAKPSTATEIRESVIQAGLKRIRPAVMTSATTLIALLPVLTSTGRGADIMIPMAIPAFGGMIVASVTYFVVPVLYSLREERKLKYEKNEA